MPKDAMRARLLRQLDGLPEDPGVYLMKGRDGATIYVGKAKNLRRRVRSYFQPGRRDGRRLFRRLLRSIVAVECVLTATEQEALALEALQIRALRPRYNIALKENREYPYIRVTVERFPRVEVARRLDDDGSRYLGPFSDIRAMHDTLALVIPRFGLRTCSLPLVTTSSKPCLELHLHRCSGPCAGLVNETAYGAAVEGAIRVIQGQDEEVLAELHKAMEQAAGDQLFERASRYRDQIGALRFMRNRQKVWLDEPVNRDVVGLARTDGHTSVCLLSLRHGHLQGCLHWVTPRRESVADVDTVLALLGQRYQEPGTAPEEIQTALSPPAAPALDALSGPDQAAPVWFCPEPGSHVQDLADLNARRMLSQRNLRLQ
jgi:excinuclease ABC subunit C